MNQFTCKFIQSVCFFMQIRSNEDSAFIAETVQRLDISLGIIKFSFNLRIDLTNDLVTSFPFFFSKEITQFSLLLSLELFLHCQFPKAPSIYFIAPRVLTSISIWELFVNAQCRSIFR